MSYVDYYVDSILYRASDPGTVYSYWSINFVFGTFRIFAWSGGNPTASLRLPSWWDLSSVSEL